MNAHETPDNTTPGTGRRMPSLSSRFSNEIKDFYRFSFSDDGYPCQRRDDGTLYEHPIYPIYILNDYLFQLDQDPANDTLRTAINTIVTAILKRVEPIGDGLFFMYDSSAGVSRANHKHPSGLTQAYYADLFSRLTAVLPDNPRIVEAAEKFYRSVFTPVSEGGVARDLFGGLGIEEVPLDHPDLVLNGWLSALKAIMDTADRRRGWSKDARVVANLDLLETLLPRYDHPATANSRYSLAGGLTLRLRVKKRQSFTLKKLAVNYGEGRIDPLTQGGALRWSNSYKADGGSVVVEGDRITVKGGGIRINYVWSRARPVNALVAELEEASAPIHAEVLIGEYTPLAAGPTNVKSELLRTITPDERGSSLILEPSRKTTDLIGYPTNFIKKIGSKRRNVYHAIHINRLWQLATRTKRPVFKKYARRWTEYALSWPDNPIYASLDYEPIDTRLPKVLMRYVERQRQAAARL